MLDLKADTSVTGWICRRRTFALVGLATISLALTACTPGSGIEPAPSNPTANSAEDEAAEVKEGPANDLTSDEVDLLRSTCLVFYPVDDSVINKISLLSQDDADYFVAAINLNESRGVNSQDTCLSLITTISGL
jgi:hypothetical protein